MTAPRGRAPRARRDLVAHLAVAGLLLVLGVAGGAVVAGWARQRRDVQAALDREEAGAARLLYHEVMRASAERRGRLLAPVLDMRDDAPPLTLAAFARHADRVLDATELRGDTLRGAFVLPAGWPASGGAVATTGALARDAALRDAVLAAVAERLRLPVTADDEPLASFATARGEPLGIAFADEGGVPSRARRFGVVYARRPTQRRAVEAALTRVPLLSPAVHPGAPALRPSAVALRGTQPRPVANDHVAFRTWTEGLDSLYATPNGAGWFGGRHARESFRSPAGGMRVEAAVDPALAERLAAAAVPRPQQAALGAALALGVLCALGALWELRRQRELARARALFVSAVSHELRTPLTQICLFSETLLDGGAESPEQERRWLGVIAREAHRLGAMVENVLVFARSERGAERSREGGGVTAPVAPRACDLAAVADDVAALLAPLAAARGATLAVRGPTQCSAWADPGAVRQILINLVDNAAKYGPDGQTVTVALEPPDADGAVRFAVTDAGPGIAPADRARVFRAFERAVVPGSTREGVGLGLSVVAALVAGHGGRVAVEDGPGGGTRMAVWLPGAPNGVA